MLDKLLHEFLLKGYMRIKAAEPQIRVAFKITGDGVRYVCFFDDTEGFLKPGIVSGCLQKVEYLLQNDEKISEYANKEIKGLAVILTNDPSHTRKSLSESDSFWLIHQPTKRLMVFDDQPGEFFEARSCIEECLGMNGLKMVFGQLKLLFSPVNTVLICLNILIFIFMEILGSTSDLSFMHQCGAMAVSDILDKGQYWKLIASAFLHFGATHLTCNMISLLYLGKPLEKYLGSARYLVLYLICALFGNAVSLFWYNHLHEFYSISAGASGAVCGVAGGLAYIMLRTRKNNRNFSFVRWFIFVALVAGQGFGAEGVDNAAHVGGFIAGFLLGMLFYHTSKTNKKQPQT